jgi:uncharacterized protein (DUF433 family)
MPIFDVGQYMTIDPEIMHGRLTFKGTRIPVSTVLAHLAKGESIDGLVRNWPQLSREAIAEAVRMATEALHQRYALELDEADDEAREIWDASFGTTLVEAKANARKKREAELAAEFAGS